MKQYAIFCKCGYILTDYRECLKFSEIFSIEINVPYHVGALSKAFIG